MCKCNGSISECYTGGVNSSDNQAQVDFSFTPLVTFCAEKLPDLDTTAIIHDLLQWRLGGRL